MLLDDDADDDLTTLVADGDCSAIAELFDRYAPQLLGLAQAIVGPSIEAEEILHEIFLEAWRTAPTVTQAPKRSLRVWLFARMRERCLQERREAPELGPHASPPTLLPHKWRHRGRFDLTPVDDPSLGRVRSQLHQLLSDLSETTRKCLELSLFEGLTTDELAERTQLPAGQIMGHFAQAHEILSQGLTNEWS